MAYSREQRQEAYKKLSEDAQYFIASTETWDLIMASLSEAGISQGVADGAASEVLYAMYGLQTLDASIENIAKLSGKPMGSLLNLKSRLEEKIFNRLSGVDSKPTTPSEEIALGIVNESAKLADARQGFINEIEHPKPAPEKIVPAPQANEPKLEAPKPEESAVSLAPANLPTVEPTKPSSLIENKIKNVVATPPIKSAYPGGLDPYREPAN